MIEKNDNKLAAQLNAIYAQYHGPEYLAFDPLCCVRRFCDPAQREIVGLLASAIAYGRVERIIASIDELLCRMKTDPLDFTMHTTFREKTKLLDGFKHRFNDGLDIALLLEAVRRGIDAYGSLEQLAVEMIGKAPGDMRSGLAGFTRKLKAFGTELLGARRPTFEYLLPSPEGGSACKRLNMYFRWMVRPDDGIDLGLWGRISPSLLIVPLDVHIARAGRALGLTDRRADDWRTAEEITAALRRVAPDDPVRFDFALCRYGMIAHRQA
jgi:uncharacterized protein (TIGR02757 family)